VRLRAQVAKKEWMESVRLVFDYFCERTPRSFVEARDTSVVWNYKYADGEFGRLQARAHACMHTPAPALTSHACMHAVLVCSRNIPTASSATCRRACTRAPAPAQGSHACVRAVLLCYLSASVWLSASMAATRQCACMISGKVPN
jgi:hypothetical protein